MIKELIVSELLSCSAMMAKQNQFGVSVLLRLIRRECFPFARIAMQAYQEPTNQLFGMASVSSKDYYLTTDVEDEFRAYCMSGTLYVIALVKT